MSKSEKRRQYAAYMRRYFRTSKGRIAKKKADKRWKESLKGRNWRKRWERSAKGLEWRSRNRRTWASLIQRNRSTLRRALSDHKSIGPRAGWPDAGRIEQKRGLDTIQVFQWRRFAQLQSQGIVIYLRFAASYEDALYDERCKVISISKFAKELGMLKEWEALVRKEQKLPIKLIMVKSEVGSIIKKSKRGQR